ncbi:MAG: type I restriction enzyme HsdR N-terminal domain-containing protein [Paludibacteraceae bacterium]|nr:type I restriction enzyme HsdR N-terminal domain-containing protein [Paludibacteraceae bacterium]
MNIKEVDNKEYIFCHWRRKYVRLTPEEWVRQQFLHTLVEQYDYPQSLIAVEVQLATKRRADAVVYTPNLQPLVLIEFKAESVSLTQKVLDQIAVYNRQFSVPYLIVSNGPQTMVAQVNQQSITFLPSVPTWEQVSNKTK